MLCYEQSRSFTQLFRGLPPADLEVFQIVGFYMLATGLGWMFTSLRRTSQARLAVLARTCAVSSIGLHVAPKKPAPWSRSRRLMSRVGSDMVRRSHGVAVRVAFVVRCVRLYPLV